MKSAVFSPFSRRGLSATLASAVVLGAVGVVGGAFAATGTGDASATVVAPIGFTSAATLAFGKFTNAAGTVTVNPAGTRTATTTSALLTGSTYAAGQLNVTGDGNATYSISLTGGNLTDTVSSTTMALASLTAAASTATGTAITTGTLSSGAQSLMIGGALTVSGTQVAGSYAGTYAVTLEYN